MHQRERVASNAEIADAAQKRTVQQSLAGSRQRLSAAASVLGHDLAEIVLVDGRSIVMEDDIIGVMVGETIWMMD